MNRPRYSVIIYSSDPHGEHLHWLQQLENKKVQVVLVYARSNINVGAVLNQAVANAQGEYVCLIDEYLKLQGRDWLKHLSDALEGGDYGMLGLRGSPQFEPPDFTFSAARKNTCLVKPMMTLDGLLFFCKTKLIKKHPFDAEFNTSPNIVVMEYCLRAYFIRGEKVGRWEGIGWPEEMDAECKLSDYEANYIDRIYAGLQSADINHLASWRKNKSTLETYNPQALAGLGMRVLSDKVKKLNWEKDKLEITPFVGDRSFVQSPLNLSTKTNPGHHILLGIGSGQEINLILASYNTRITVIEVEPVLVRFLLVRHDWSEAIRLGRLKIITLLNNVPGVTEVSCLQSIGVLLQPPDNCSLVESASYNLNADLYQQLKAALIKRDTAREKISHCRRPEKAKFDITVVSPYCAIFNDIAYLFKSKGFRTRVLIIPHDSHGSGKDSQLNNILPLYKTPSRFTLVRNRCLLETDALQAYLNDDLQIPGKTVSWWWDVPNVASYIDFKNPRCQQPGLAFAIEMLQLLPSGSQWLAAGARTQFCQHDIIETQPRDFKYGISFVGQSRYDLIKKNINIICCAVNRIFGNAYINITNKIATANLSEELYLRLLEFQPKFDRLMQELGETTPVLSYYLDYIYKMCVSGAFRIAAIETLIRAKLPLHVFGDAHWSQQGIVPENNFGGVVEPENLLDLFNQSKINLNLNFMQVSSTVNPKVLDICASGNVALTDFRPELERLYPDAYTRPFVFSDLEQLVERCQNLLDMDLRDHRRAVGEYTRSRHSLEKRVDWIIDYYGLRARGEKMPAVEAW